MCVLKLNLVSPKRAPLHISLLSVLIFTEDIHEFRHCAEFSRVLLHAVVHIKSEEQTKILYFVFFKRALNHTFLTAFSYIIAQHTFIFTNSPF
jgi:uncharacterized protein YhhL (DUF1145 family)